MATFQKVKKQGSRILNKSSNTIQKILGKLGNNFSILRVSYYF